MGHTHVMAAFHRYHPGSPWSKKRGTVELALRGIANLISVFCILSWRIFG
jgi:hypothetical protein